MVIVPLCAVRIGWPATMTDKQHTKVQQTGCRAGTPPYRGVQANGKKMERPHLQVTIKISPDRKLAADRIPGRWIAAAAHVDTHR